MRLYWGGSLLGNDPLHGHNPFLYLEKCEPTPDGMENKSECYVARPPIDNRCQGAVFLLSASTSSPALAQLKCSIYIRKSARDVQKCRPMDTKHIRVGDVGIDEEPA